MYYILDKEMTPYQTTLDQVVKNIDKMKHIQEDILNDGTEIKTTFLFYGQHKYDGKPLLFNTKVIKETELYSELYKTYDEAIDGHNRVLEMYKQSI
jgi:hypothetical protein